MNVYLRRNIEDVYENSDYTGNANRLMNPINRLITNAYLPFIKPKIDEKLKKPYKSIHLVLASSYDEETKLVNDLHITFEYTDNLCSDTSNDDYSDLIQEIIDGYFREIGYPVDTHDPIDFIGRMYCHVQQIKEYFEIR